MFAILVVLFITVPIVEIMLFIQVGGLIGMWPTIAIVLITAIAGAHLVRSQGLQILGSIQEKIQRGEAPAQQMVEGMLLAVAGVLLLTPGFMTDFFGLLCLIPPTRAWFAQQIMTRTKVNMMSGDFSTHQPHSSYDEGNVYEGEYEKANNEDKRLD